MIYLGVVLSADSLPPGEGASLRLIRYLYERLNSGPNFQLFVFSSTLLIFHSPAHSRFPHQVILNSFTLHPLHLLATSSSVRSLIISINDIKSEPNFQLFNFFYTFDFPLAGSLPPSPIRSFLNSSTLPSFANSSSALGLLLSIIDLIQNHTFNFSISHISHHHLTCAFPHQAVSHFCHNRSHRRLTSALSLPHLYQGLNSEPNFQLLISHHLPFPHQAISQLFHDESRCRPMVCSSIPIAIPLQLN